jgi:NAD+ kinase
MNTCSPTGFSPNTVALVGKFNSPEINGPLLRLSESLHQRGVAVLVESETAAQVDHRIEALDCRIANFEEMGADADLVIVLGGDGTMLHVARHLARFDVPLVGVNQGRLGFMADIARDDIYSYLDDLMAGRFRPERRMLLQADIVREGAVVATHVALNDVVVDKGAIGRMIDLELRIDDEFIYNLRADGFIMSTPTGSTAYSMSAGGPIVHPAASGIVLVPLCPHALTNRPILVNDDAKVEVRVRAGADPRVHFDGQITLDLQKDDWVRLKRYAHDICLLHPPGYSYFSMLRQKLHWSEGPRAH